MSRLFFLLVAVGLLVGCNNEPEVTPVVHSPEKIAAAKAAAADNKGGESGGLGGRNATREARDAARGNR